MRFAGRPENPIELCQLIIRPVRYSILLFFVVTLAVACGKTKEAAIPSGSAVLALGDSLTEGYGVSPEEAWPNLLAGKTGWLVFNGGVSGDTSGEALQRLPALLQEHDPVLVLVALGGNDMLRHIPMEETFLNHKRIFDLIKANGAKAVLLATPKPSIAGAAFRNLSAPDFYREIAEKNQVKLIEDAIPDVLSDPQMKVDPLHPNVAGHVQLAENILEALQSIGYSR